MEKEHRLLVLLNTSVAWGGLEMNTVRLAKWLCRYREVLLLCTEHSSIAQEALRQGIMVEYVSRKGKYLPLRASWKLSRMLRKKQVSRLLFCDNKDMAYCCWTKKFSGKPFKIFYQQHMQLGINKKDLIHTWRFRLLNAWISPLSWLAEEAAQKTKIDPAKIHVIPLGIETEELLSHSLSQQEARELFNLKCDFPVIGIMGRIDPKKNQHVLIQAAKDLKDRGIYVYLFLVGEPTKNDTSGYAGKLHRMVQDLGLENQVSFHPFTDQVAAFYKALDIFVMATDGETYGMVTLESMLFETPVIATNSGGSPEILQYGDLGTLFEPENAQDLAGKITYVLDHSDEIARKVTLAKEHVLQYFDYKTECEQLLRLIEAE